MAVAFRPEHRLRQPEFGHRGLTLHDGTERDPVIAHRRFEVRQTIRHLHDRRVKRLLERPGLRAVAQRQTTVPELGLSKAVLRAEGYRHRLFEQFEAVKELLLP